MSSPAFPAMYLGEDAFRVPDLPNRVAAVVQEVAFETGVPRSMILGPSQDAVSTRARHACFFIASVGLQRTSVQIGAAMNRDHSTVRHGLARAIVFRERDPAFRDLTDRLVARVLGDRA